MSNSSFKATAVIVTSPKCGTCNVYKNEKSSDGTTRRDRIVSSLNSIDDIRVIEIETMNLSPQTIKSTADKYHPQLSKFIRWFPIITLFNHSLNDRNSQLDGVIYGAINVGGQIKPSGGLKLFEGDLVKNWVNNELNDNPIFNRSNYSSSSSSNNSSIPIPRSKKLLSERGSIVKTKQPYGFYIRDGDGDDGEGYNFRKW